MPAPQIAAIFSKVPLMKHRLCPCDSGQQLARCCGRFVFAAQAPATAEQLMRSRYVAYVLGEQDYLLRTWHPDTRPADLPLSHDSTWLGLQILRRVQQSENHALVEFVARYRINGKGYRLHETSRFERLGNQWLYLDGRFAEEK